MRVHALFGSRADVVLFVGPIVAAASAVAVHHAHGGGPEVGLVPWLVFVAFIDVGHVWSTLWVSLLHGAQRRAHAQHFGALALVLYGVGVALHAGLGALAFWRVVAYGACFHFVRQQVGWVHLARARAGELDVPGARLDAAVTTLAAVEPLAYWHVHGRSFGWLVAGDFVRLAPLTLTLVRAAFVGAVVLFVVREAQAARRGDVHLGKLLVVASTAVGWHLAIEVADSDYVFTAFNVLAHAAPYVHLVATRSEPDTVAGASVLGVVPALLFLGVLLTLGLGEELAWDALVWGEHFFSETPRWARESASAIVPLLALPQLVHYALDALLWRRRHEPSLRAA
jgi:hypothetical protein